MKKTVITLAVVAFAAAAVQAQTTTSANIVGYNKHNLSAGLQIEGIQFTSSADTTVEGLFGSSLSTGSKVYAFDASAGYEIATYVAGFFGSPDAWDKDITLPLGSAFWVELASGSTNVIQAGEVNSDASVDVSIVTGLQLIANPYPVEISVQTAGFTPQVDDKVYVYTGTGYDIATYVAGFFGSPDAWDKDITIAVGQGFWYEAAADQTWTVASPIQ